MKKTYLTVGVTFFLILSAVISISAIEYAGWNSLSGSSVSAVGSSNSTSTSNSTITSNSTSTSNSTTIIMSGFCGANVQYTLDNGKLIISGNGDMYDYEYRSPSPWQESNVQDVVIESGVTSIGNYAFYSCKNLESITIPDSVKIIGNSSFGNCSRMTNIIIPDSVTSIGNAAFSGCSGMTSITVSNGVTCLEEGVFYNCKSLQSIIIPEGVKSIKTEAFAHCNSLKNIVLPDSVTKIEAVSFFNCNSLTSITIPDSITRIEASTFNGCSSLRSINIPDSVTSIEFKAFYNCSSLRSITIPDSVTRIGDLAFNGCSSLERVLFALSDEEVDISFGEKWLPNNTDLTIYCHIYTAPDVYFSTNSGYKTIYIENVGIDGVRNIMLPDDLVIECGDVVDLEYDIFPFDGTPIIWTSSDTTLLSVENGTITALAPGTVTVTATVGTISDNMIITIHADATGLILNETEIWLQAKESIKLYIKEFIPKNSSVESIVWSSSDTTRAIVDSSGMVTTIRPGDVKITATSDKNIMADCILHLTYPVSTVTMEPTSAVMKLGETLQLITNAITSHENYLNKLVSFSTSDETIARVDENGVVSALSTGTVDITATADSGVTATCTVTIKGLDEMQILTLPSSLSTIDSEAFSGLDSAEAVRIPETVTEIADDAFTGSDIVILAPEGSYAIQWAIDNEVPYIVE